MEKYEALQFRDSLRHAQIRPGAVGGDPFWDYVRGVLEQYNAPISSFMNTGADYYNSAAGYRALNGIWQDKLLIKSVANVQTMSSTYNANDFAPSIESAEQSSLRTITFGMMVDLAAFIGFQGGLGAVWDRTGTESPAGFGFFGAIFGLGVIALPNLYAGALIGAPSELNGQPIVAATLAYAPGPGFLLNIFLRPGPTFAGFGLGVGIGAGAIAGVVNGSFTIWR